MTNNFESDNGIVPVAIRENMIVKIHGIPHDMTKEEAAKIAGVVVALGGGKAPVYRGPG